MKNTIAVITALLIMFIGLLAAFILWESSPNEALKIEGEEGHLHHHHEHSHNHTHDEEHAEWIAFSDEQIDSGHIELQQATSGALKERVAVTGKTRIPSDHLAHVTPKVSGIVVDVRKNLGDHTEANEVLAIIESREMAEAKATYLAALKREQLKNKVFQQERELFEKQLSSQQDFLHAEADLAEVAIDLELTRQHLLAMGIDANELNLLEQADRDTLRYYSLRSPIAGTVIYRDLIPGELLQTDHEAYHIADLTTSLVELDIPNGDFCNVKIGNPVTIYTCEGKQAQSTLAYISPMLNEETRKGTAIASIPQQALNCAVGTFVYADIETGCCTPPLVVPKEALQKFEGINVVFVKENAGFAIRPVQVGRGDASQIEILAGISSGETYAVKNAFLIKAEQGKAEAHHEH